MRTKIITILIAGAVFTAGLMAGFGGYVFAGDPVPGLDINIEQIPGGSVSAKNYKSSLSNTKTIGQVRMEVGDVLLRYGFSGEYINQVTEALEGGGVYEAELKSFLLAVGMNEQDAQNILLEFDKLGISKDGAQAVSADSPEKEFTEGATPSVAGQPGAGQIEKAVSIPDTTGAVPRAIGSETKREETEREETEREGLPSKQAEPAPATTDARDAARADPIEEIELAVERVYKATVNLTENLKAAESKEQRGDIIKELKYHRVLLQQGVQTLRQDLRENSQELRDNFRENVKTTIGHVDHGKTGRIALAHGKGLRMINRYRSAIARFDHILGRLESRIEKIEAQGVDVSAVIPLVEEAKNMSIENEVKIEELKAKYESLLLGENAGGIAEEARAIAKELKVEIEKLRGLLDDIQRAATDYNSSISNSSSTL